MKKKNNVLWQKPEETFLQYLLWEPSRNPLSISQSIVGDCLRLDPPMDITLRLFHTQPLQFINNCSGFPAQALVESLYLF